MCLCLWKNKEGLHSSLLNPKDKQKILEIGSGSGYVLALLSVLNANGKIWGIERIKELAESSKEKLKEYKNIEVINRDGSKGFEEQSPFDRILVSASSDNEIPERLIEQLKINGILVIPIKNSIIKLQKKETQNKIEEYEGFSFVPLIRE